MVSAGCYAARPAAPWTLLRVVLQVLQRLSKCCCWQITHRSLVLLVLIGLLHIAQAHLLHGYLQIASVDLQLTPS